MSASGAWRLAGGAADDDVLEYIVVTGSRIARSDFESPSPIVTVPAVAFEQTGAVSVERVLDRYPQFVTTSGATSNNPSNDGQANVSLRGLGSNRTLVLLDGRRLMPADGQGSVDLNVLPPSLIKDVQVLTGGASTAYGSDAIAGVVNFELMDAFEGVEIDASMSQTDRSDGGEYSIGVTGGTRFGEGRGSIVAYLGYAERAAIQQSARSFSKYPLMYYPDETQGRGPGGAFLASGDGINDDALNIIFSSEDAFNEVFAGYGHAPGTVDHWYGLGVNAGGTVFTTGTGAPGGP
jgi:outer membrane receptor protein involved in Fe transport